METNRYFARLWSRRNWERVYVFADGHVYGSAERREGVRACIRLMREEKARIAQQRRTGRPTPRG